MFLDSETTQILNDAYSKAKRMSAAHRAIFYFHDLVGHSWILPSSILVSGMSIATALKVAVTGVLPLNWATALGIVALEFALFTLPLEHRIFAHEKAHLRYEKLIKFFDAESKNFECALPIYTVTGKVYETHSEYKNFLFQKAKEVDALEIASPDTPEFLRAKEGDFTPLIQHLPEYFTPGAPHNTDDEDFLYSSDSN